MEKSGTQILYKRNRNSPVVSRSADQSDRKFCYDPAEREGKDKRGKKEEEKEKKRSGK